MGDSRETVPAYALTEETAGGDPHVCDVVFVDGDHTEEGAYADLVSLQELASRCDLLDRKLTARRTMFYVLKTLCSCQGQALKEDFMSWAVFERRTMGSLRPNKNKLPLR